MTELTGQDLIEWLKAEGYKELREVPGRGVCAIERMLFTTGLFYGLTRYEREGRYCYETYTEALRALEQWDGVGDPPGDWIVHKGKKGRYCNKDRPDYNPLNDLESD
jgi:hypothetical protein